VDTDIVERQSLAFDQISVRGRGNLQTPRSGVSRCRGERRSLGIGDALVRVLGSACRAAAEFERIYREETLESGGWRGGGVRRS